MKLRDAPGASVWPRAKFLLSKNTSSSASKLDGRPRQEPQVLKPGHFYVLTARLKSCPDTCPAVRLPFSRQKCMEENFLKLHGKGQIPGMLRLWACTASGTRAALSMTSLKHF